MGIFNLDDNVRRGITASADYSRVIRQCCISDALSFVRRRTDFILLQMIIQVIAFILTLGCWAVWITASFDSPLLATAAGDSGVGSAAVAGSSAGGGGEEYLGGWGIPMVNTGPVGSQVSSLYDSERTACHH